MFKENLLAERNGTGAVISMMDWFKLTLISLIACIPFIGFIVVIVMYCVLAFSQETAVSIRNYLKLELIISVIAIAICLVIGLICGVAIFSALPFAYN